MSSRGKKLGVKQEPLVPFLNFFSYLFSMLKKLSISEGGRLQLSTAARRILPHANKRRASTSKHSGNIKSGVSCSAVAQAQQGQVNLFSPSKVCPAGLIRAGLLVCRFLNLLGK